MADFFWHRPGEEKRWHSYSTSGHSLCGKWCLVGTGMPKDARVRMPKLGRCGECIKRTAWQKTLRRLQAERERKALGGGVAK